MFESQSSGPIKEQYREIFFKFICHINRDWISHYKLEWSFRVRTGL